MARDSECRVGPCVQVRSGLERDLHGVRCQLGVQEGPVIAGERSRTAGSSHTACPAPPGTPAHLDLPVPHELDERASEIAGNPRLRHLSINKQPVAILRRKRSTHPTFGWVSLRLGTHSSIDDLKSLHDALRVRRGVAGGGAGNLVSAAATASEGTSAACC